MLSAYPACFIKEQKGYSVVFPDLNYLATCGNTLEEALNRQIMNRATWGNSRHHSQMLSDNVLSL